MTLGCSIVVNEGERLTNIRYANNLLVFATSAKELCWMTEILQEESARVGLQLTSLTTRALRLQPADSPRFLIFRGKSCRSLAQATSTSMLDENLVVP